MKKDIILTARPPIIKNLAFAVIYAFFCFFVFFIYNLVKIEEPQNIMQKVLESVLFTIFMLVLFACFLAFVNCIRNIICLPTVRLTDDTIFVVGNPEISLKSIEKMELKRNKMIIKSNDGLELKIKSKIVNIPLETFKYAVNLRLKTIIDK